MKDKIIKNKIHFGHKYYILSIHLKFHQILYKNINKYIIIVVVIKYHNHLY